ncbi:MAG: 2Fe-2S iron-sulfur cluster-binding protein [Candidatus Aminicenantia bacterium]
MANIRINDLGMVVQEGKTILEVAREKGIYIPTLCYNEALKPYGACRLCVVEVEENGRKNVVTSCTTPVKDGMRILTNSEKIWRTRKILIELLLARVPESKKLQELANYHGLEKSRFSLKDEDCILCGLCVRACDERVGRSAIGFMKRGTEREVGIPFEKEFSEDCVGCGACTYLCPTGAIQMEAKTLERFRKFRAEYRKCRYMMMGVVDYKLCPNNYQCWHCEVDQRMEELFGTHPALVFRKKEEEEPVEIYEFVLFPNYLYSRGHIWAKKFNGRVRVGMDDFARKLIGKMADLKTHGKNDGVNAGNELWELKVGNRKAVMLAPFDLKVKEVNPDVLDNPPIAYLDPYRKGWVLDLEPYDPSELRSRLLQKNRAKLLFKEDSESLHSRFEKELGVTITDGGEIAPTLHKLLTSDAWDSIISEFLYRI